MENIYEEFKHCVIEAENIFDIYINIYYILKRNLNDLKKSLEIEYKEDKDWKIYLIDMKDQENFNINISKEYKTEILKITPKEDKYKILSFIKLVFEVIDEIAGDDFYKTSEIYIQEDDGKNIRLGYLNTKVSLEIGEVFYQEKNFLAGIIDSDDRFSMEKDIGETVEIYQKNLLVKEKTHSDIKTNLFRVSDRYINRKIKNKDNEFKIALIPFSNDKDILDLEIIQRNHKDHISIKGIKQEEKYVQLVKDILKELIKFKVDIVVFPEMVFTKNMVNKVKEVLNKNRGKFLLIVCGSIWKDRSNTCIILGGNGLELGRQKKLNRYREKDDFNGIKFEDLDLSSDGKIINMYDLKGFGRFCTPICVDFINKDYFNNIADIGCNICLVPTYTTSLHSFKNKANDLGAKNFGGVFLSNYWGISKGKEISFAYIPRKKNSILSIMCEKSHSNKGGCKIPYEEFIIEIT